MLASDRQAWEFPQAKDTPPEMPRCESQWFPSVCSGVDRGHLSKAGPATKAGPLNEFAGYCSYTVRVMFTFCD